MFLISLSGKEYAIGGNYIKRKDTVFRERERSLNVNVSDDLGRKDDTMVELKKNVKIWRYSVKYSVF